MHNALQHNKEGSIIEKSPTSSQVAKFCSPSRAWQMVSAAHPHRFNIIIVSMFRSWIYDSMYVGM